MSALTRLRVPLLALSLACVACLLPLAVAHAQMSFGGGGAGGGGAGGGGPSRGGGGDADENPDDAEAKAAAAANAPPPALPGAVASDEAAPSSHAPLDMNPTTALFDAINRGDLTAAKDALSRGADLEGSNVLGEKPIEMAIDLNRNDITFLLLSMRNNDGSESGSQMVAEGSATAAGKVGGVAIEAGSAHGRKPVEQVAFKRPDQDGGVAKPEIGFLGFAGS